ncbi:MAG TPA: alpha/beta hydrolase fold domain-containing protein [Marmoricola sp.]|nr:alpha/beta hydrolase fold domain-containing protein [Marmoricola sp.]
MSGLDQTLVLKLRSAARSRSATKGPGPSLDEVTDFITEGTRLRRYCAVADHSSTDVVFVFAHGGYFIFGDLDLQDRYCRHLALAFRGVVYSVDYALAPEARAVASIRDVLAVASLARVEHPDARIVLCGDSAGGTVAFLAATKLRGTPHAADALFLTNPNLDLSLAMFDRLAPDGPDPDLLKSAIEEWAGPSGAVFDFSPMASVLDGLPATLIAVGVLDSLVPEAVAMNERLLAAGVRTEILQLDGVGHGFVSGSNERESFARDQAFVALRAFLEI